LKQARIFKQLRILIVPAKLLIAASIFLGTHFLIHQKIVQGGPVYLDKIVIIKLQKTEGDPVL
jgi:hypothetical protein